MTKEKAKKGFIVRALDTVERVGNGLPNPATIFLILTGIVIVLSAVCAALGVSVTYDFLDSASGEISQKTVQAVNLLAPDSIHQYFHCGRLCKMGYHGSDFRSHVHASGPVTGADTGCLPYRRFQYQYHCAADAFLRTDRCILPEV